MLSAEIRDIFIEIFKKNGHVFIKPSPLVQEKDPTLMFTNAGMNQFKDIFVGKREMGNEGTRLVDSQVCLRVSGKHNDLDEVGTDTYHHTLFEMLGNWSMNDYFKKEAIEYGWRLLTEGFGIEKDRLYVTVFGGDSDDGIEKDNEAYEIWEKYVEKDHIVLGNKKDNFWEMGETGPCGPCTEIHIDLRDEDKRRSVCGRELVNSGNPEVVEIWNIVFIQFERLRGGELRRLEKRFVDTGMGFERLVMILQGKKSNYDTDVFSRYIEKIERLSVKKYGENEKVDIAFRVIADHVRAVVMTIAEGLNPSNVKAGYVIRRILRRAVRYGYSFLNFEKPFLYLFVDDVLDYFKFLGKSNRNSDEIRKIIEGEEEGFFKTLKCGIKRLDKIVSVNVGEVVSGENVFELYDTYGFPVDLTEIILKEKGFSFDKKRFEELLEEQKSRSREVLKESNKEWIFVVDGESEFVGYDCDECESRILKYRDREDGFEVVFEKTPFYGESGGQVGDSGVVVCGGVEIKVKDVKKINGENVHFVDRLMEMGNIREKCLLKIDSERRRKIESAHSCAHLVHWCLRKMFGEGVVQKGSKVSDGKFRFDFNFDRNLTDSEIGEIENIVNEKVSERINVVERREVEIDEARKNGVIGLFKDKYGEKVRVVEIGESKEMCCGTHVKNTGDIGKFKILKCRSVSSGVRRVECVCERFC